MPAKRVLAQIDNKSKIVLIPKTLVEWVSGDVTVLHSPAPLANSNCKLMGLRISPRQ